MIAVILVLLSFTPHIEPNQIGHQGNTALAVKKVPKNYNYTIPTEISDFSNLVRRSSVFLDNTLFCREVLNNMNHAITIFSPSQWGKTTLLTMLKAFLEIQVDEQGNTLSKQFTRNYKLFKKGVISHDDGTVESLKTPLLIADDEQSMKHQGEYPVIYVNFENAVGQDFGEIERNVSLSIYRAFKHHEYMTARLIRKSKTGTELRKKQAENNLEQFKRYMEAARQLKMKFIEVWGSLMFLNQQLIEHFGRMSYLLIDGFEAPLHCFLEFDTISQQDEETIYHFVDHLGSAASADGYKFQRIILTGTFNFKFQGFQSYQVRHIVDNYLPKECHGNRVQFARLREYFGFKEAQVRFLLDNFNITGRFAQQVKNWYNGYQTDVSNYTFYRPASIMKFLHRKQIECYRSTKTYNKLIQKLLHQESGSRRKLLRFISKHKFQFYGSPESDLWKIRSYEYYQSTYQRQSLSRFFDIILLSEDFLVRKAQTLNNIVPNNEVAYLMSSWLITHYEDKYRIDTKSLNIAARALHEFIRTESTTDSLNESFRQVFKDIQLNIAKGIHDEDSAHAVLNCIALQMQRAWKFDMDVYYDNVKTADLMIHDHSRQHQVVVQLSENQPSAKSAYDFARNYTNFLTLSNDTLKVHIIGINIFANRSIDILADSIPIKLPHW